MRRISRQSAMNCTLPRYVLYRSGGFDLCQEMVHFASKVLGFQRELLGRAQHLARCGTSVGRRLLDGNDVAGDLLGPARCLLYTAGNLLRSRALLLDGGRYCSGYLVDLLDGRADFTDSL